MHAMNLSKIKQLVKNNGATFILVENGEPEMVVLSFEAYEKLAGNEKIPEVIPRAVEKSTKQSPMLDDITPESKDMPETEFIEFMDGVSTMVIESERDPAGVRLEDLPL